MRKIEIRETASVKKKDGRLWEITLIQPGLSGNKRRYEARVLKEAAPPFEGAWFDPRCVPPGAGAATGREVEILSTEHILSTLSVLGYGLENEKMEAGLKRLIEFQAEDGRWILPKPEMTYGFTWGALMTIKSLHEPLRVYSLHGH